MNASAAGLPQAAPASASAPSVPGSDGTPLSANPQMQSPTTQHTHSSPNLGIGGAGAARGQPLGTAPHLAVGPYPVLNNKRGPVACKRCRRAKTKCLHNGQPPCRSCAESGLAAECVFPPKGTSFIDRAPAKKARRATDPPTSTSPNSNSNSNTSSSANTAHTTTPQLDTGAGSLGVPIAPGPSPHGHSHAAGQSPIHLSHPHLPHPLSQVHDEETKPVGSPTVASPVGHGRYPSVTRSGSGGSNPRSRLTPKPGSSPASASEETLPPLPLLEEACEIFFGQVNQCAFLHKPSFLARLGDPAQSPSPLLLLSICALTVRFSPSLAQFCGTTKKSATYFHDTARALLFESLGDPSVEACQAGYFLGLADWSACRGRRSWMIMGIATRMALLLGLHREETHVLPPNPTPNQIVQVETARRTFWTLFVNDRSVSGGGASCRPSGIQASEISTRLPCDEDSFAFGQPTPAYYLKQLDDPAWHQVNTGVDLGMMAYMVHSAELWGRAARRVCAGASSTSPFDPNSTSWDSNPEVAPWNPNSEFAQIKAALSRWRSQLPPRQQYSRSNLAVYHQRNSGMSFSYNHCMNQAAEVLLRRPYLPFIVRSLAPEGSGLSLEGVGSPWPNMPGQNPTPEFWAQCGREMFEERAYEVPLLVLRSTEILSSMIPTWPMARQWVRLLRQPIKKRIDEAVQDDMVTDQREGVYRQASISNHADGGSASSEGGDDDADGEPDGPMPNEQAQGPITVEQSPATTPTLTHSGAMNPATPRADIDPTAWNVAPSLHTLALAAQQQQQERHPQQPQSRHPNMGPHEHPGMHVPLATPIAYGPLVGTDMSMYSLLGPYSEMPFGHPSNPNSFGDVLAFMSGSEQWAG
ncbi:hypothetical protein PUNSTDRAFT_128311 [Punctularia strigosozonata HHB-11173 SS5]|uniref:Zn(2)-C6 fungal-type domain-containing protein n=1 Tax=Punctularia strigosozonata (strain HHB-11173) TaxID=741275 RepID=R7S220_PUNST|nr:uncharacterized protein PUNSTDRAFT_128311 [Punctularia strigosozonata HHB-11173 SS5]EIN04455.1 hypothetical protein PUNSTDRAFT_128311 [Punctularia strigosozonata HHB-11173 SS5]